MRKRLPIGIQTFAKIREDDCYYVDKTGFALDLIESGSHYFLSRPRRFGKSLFLSTLAEIFAGNEALFRGLIVHDCWDWSVRYPVLRVSFGGGVLQSRQALVDKVEEIVRDNAGRLGLACDYDFADRRCFAQLIARAHEKYGQRVVVLVDEYDKPILDNLGEPEIARRMRDGLRDLYSVIKDSDEHIRFAFLTGVSKFSKVSLFSGLNNLRDITLSSEYSAICGYTEADVDTVFAPELAGLDRQEIRAWYNGYNWGGEAVYNPFDLLLLFKERKFRPYWFETGTPTFLVDLLMERRFHLPDLARLQTGTELLGRFDVDDIATEALLFQTGYLTVSEVRDIPGQEQYTLSYPNLEVRTSLNQCLGGALVHDPSNHNRLSVRLYDLLLAGDFAGLKELFQAFFASIPHDWYRKNTIAHYEGYYASVFYSYFAALGLDITVEEATNRGRIDMAVRLADRIYLFEFKVVELVPEGQALAQLIAKGYAEKYRGRGEPIYLIGVEFSGERRNIVGFEVARDEG